MEKELIPILETKEEKEIKNLIYMFREKQVMLDSDIAELFEVEVKQLNRQMKRNKNRFPEDFCFQLNSIELKNQRCQNVTFRESTKNRKYMPFVYTEQGIITLAGVLKSEVADQMSIKIARVFIKMKNALIAYAEPLEMISQVHGELIQFKEYTIKQFDDVFSRIEKLEPKKEVLLLDGKWFDALEAIYRLIERAKLSIVLVDPYADEKALNYLSHRNDGVSITLYKSKRSKLSDFETEAFKKTIWRNNGQRVQRIT